MFKCPKCDTQYPKWQGRCSECGNWGLIEEEIEIIKTKDKNKNDGKMSSIFNLSDVVISENERIKTNIGEVDLVFGGGIIKGSLTLLAGQPGIGKSTLVMQIAAKFVKQNENDFVLYVSGEETKEQVKNRLNRINKNNINIQFSGDVMIENIITTIEKINPTLVIIDSIQTMFSKDLENSVGSINQIKACTTKLLDVAKRLNIPIIIIGHITKEGNIGGPKALEHIVDVVLYFEIQKYKNFRILRSIKNRFGNTNEVGIFEMKEDGLNEVLNPSEVFIENKIIDKGNVITCTQEGTRPFLIEVQALVSKTAFGYPKRAVSGFSLNRLEMLIAVLTKKIGLELFNYDIYINIVGGINPKDTGLDSAVALSIISAYLNKEVDKNICIFGEIGLSGEIRSVGREEARIKEAKKMGLTKIITPKFKNNIDGVVNIESVKDLIKILQ